MIYHLSHLIAFDVEFNGNTIFGIVNMLGTIFAFIYFGTYKIARMEVKVDTLWLFQLRRGMIEAEQKGLATYNSPVCLTGKAEEVLEPLLPPVKEFYKKIKGHTLGIVDLSMLIEEAFWPDIVEKVCKPVGVSEGACLVLVIAKIRGLEVGDLSNPRVQKLINMPLKDLPPHGDVKAGKSFLDKYLK